MTQKMGQTNGGGKDSDSSRLCLMMMTFHECVTRTTWGILYIINIPAYLVFFRVLNVKCGGCSCDEMFHEKRPRRLFVAIQKPTAIYLYPDSVRSPREVWSADMPESSQRVTPVASELCLYLVL